MAEGGYKDKIEHVRAYAISELWEIVEPMVVKLEEDQVDPIKALAALRWLTEKIEKEVGLEFRWAKRLDAPLN